MFAINIGGFLNNPPATESTAVSYKNQMAMTVSFLYKRNFSSLNILVQLRLIHPSYYARMYFHLKNSVTVHDFYISLHS